MKNQFPSHGSRNRPGSLRPHRMPFHLFIGPLMEQAGNRKRSVGVRPYLECLEARSLLTAVTAVSPVNVNISGGVGGVGIAAKVQATFDVDMNRTTINTSTFQLRDSSNNLIPAYITYNATNKTATLDTNAPLAYSTTYTATVVGGSAGVKDTSGSAMAANYTWSFTTGANPTTGPGGPILVVTSAANPFDSYYPEILRAEGLNEFATADISTVTASTLTGYDVVILAQQTLTPAQVTMFTNWVTTNGGDLIAMHPDKQLAGLLGLTDASSTLSDAYLAVNTTSGPGAGITGQAMQFHGAADRYNLSGATSVATLYSNPTTPTSNPAVTLRSVGTNGGQAAAFTYDLATSVVYTRQGNPAWDGQERDGSPPIRSDDLYFGGTSPDYVNLTRDSVPGADEQQRLLANLITQMDLAKKPLPRLWYFPDGAKAMVLETGDDHNNGGTAGRFDTFLADGTSGGQPIRGSSYMYPNTPLTDAEAASYTAQGFELGLHVANVDANGNPVNWTPSQLNSDFTSQLSQWEANFPSLPTPSTNRTHAIVWSTYSDQPQIELNYRIRLDTNYYYWPSSWIQDQPGLFTGSAMPMRFATKNGAMIDTYQAATEMTDESGQSYPKNIGALLNLANGPQGYYGVFTVNAHTDNPSSTVADDVINTAQLYKNPVVSGRQLLGWLDYRNNSSFGSLSWNGTTLSFTITTADNASSLQGKLQAMLPLLSAAGELTGITQNGSAVAYTTQRIKGVDYAFFTANPGSYAAQYAPDTQAPTVVSQSPAPNATNVAANSTVTATFSEDMDPATITASTFALTGPSGPVPTTVTYDTASKTATLTPTSGSGLTFNSPYTATIAGGSTGVKDTSGNAMAANYTWSFTTGSTVASTSIWNSPPSLPDDNPAPDASGVELGVKFRSLVAGAITGVRFFKGDGNTGTHVGHLWDSTGKLLATATFTGETALGWQTANFSSPVTIQANTTYVASYYTPNGNYAATNSYFSGSGVNSWPLRALADGEDGSNGLYLYGSDAFPTNSYQGSNYWVDVVFASGGGPDTTPPTVTNQTPAPNATNVATNTTVIATFNEAIQAGTATFTLTGPGGAVPGSVSYTTNTATFTPSSPLAYSTTYTATVSGAKDLAGNAMTTPVTWSFTTAPAPGTGPYSLWSPSDVPGTPFVSDSAVEVGVKFTSNVAGKITGIRFYKGVGNTGTHVGNLWSSTGTKLASATFSGETASGWQQVNFATPVNITANTVYVASYHSNTGYADDDNYFNTARSNGPLTALADGTSGPNGVYRYGTGSGFPNTGYLKSNYWVDVVFQPNTTGAAAPAASLLTAGTAAPAVDPVATSGSTGTGADATAPSIITAPTIISIPSIAGTTGVSTTASLSVATFGGSIDPRTINGSTVTLLDPTGTPVPAAVTYSATTKTVRLTPEAALNPSTTYTVQIKGGVTGVTGPAGALAANLSWKFTTEARPGNGPPPQIAAIRPANGASGVDPRSKQVVVFDHEMDPATINEGTIRLVGKGIGPGGQVPYRVSYGEETQSAIIDSIGLLPGQNYTIVIKGGPKGVKDKKGNALSADVTTSFTVGQPRAGIPPAAAAPLTVATPAPPAVTGATATGANAAVVAGPQSVATGPVEAVQLATSSPQAAANPSTPTGPTTTPVPGTVTITNIPSTPISGAVAVTNVPSQTAAIPAGPLALRSPRRRLPAGHMTAGRRRAGRPLNNSPGASAMAATTGGWPGFRGATPGS